MTASRWRKVGVPLALLLHLAASATSAPDEGFSRQSTIVGCSGQSSYRSPDGVSSLISVRRPDGEAGLAVLVGGKRCEVEYPSWPCPEALWSPTSKAFLLTYSTGGLVGTFEVRVYLLSSSGLAVVDPAVAVRQDFLREYPRCFDPEDPNIVGLAWLAPDRLLLAAQVLPHSNCDRMGTFSAYEVAWPSGRIISKHGQIESKRRFAPILGSPLQSAEDDCERNPKSCWIPALHGR